MTTDERPEPGTPHEEEWAAYRQLTETPIPALSIEAEIDRLYGDLEIRNLLYSFADAVDSKDLGRIVDHFAGSALLVTDDGSSSGSTEIRAYFEPGTLLNRITYHRVQSVAIRVASDAPQATASAYLHTALIAGESDGRSLYGRLFARLVKIDEGWRFAEMRLFEDHLRAYPQE